MTTKQAVKKKTKSNNRKQTKKKTFCPQCADTGYHVEECYHCQGHRCESCGWSGYVTLACDLCRYVDKHGKVKKRAFFDPLPRKRFCRKCERQCKRENFSPAGYAAHICNDCAREH